jgi:hypothetical protein
MATTRDIQWTLDGNTWSYSSADAPTFVISINADMTAYLSPGMRVKLTQSTVKYFLITGVGSYSGGATLVTVYGGTDYTLANAAISLPYYSSMKAPVGFPLDPAKWSVLVSDTGNNTQASPTQNTWYNLGSVTISIPIGIWRVRYQTALGVDKGTATGVSAYCTLSTANNSESDSDFTGHVEWIGSSQSNLYIVGHIAVSKFLVLASKTSYYLNTRTTLATIANIYNQGASTKNIIEATSVYL